MNTLASVPHQAAWVASPAKDFKNRIGPINAFHGFVMHLMLSEERCRVLPTTDSWFGATSREDRPRVVEAIRHMIADGHYPQKLWQ